MNGLPELIKETVRARTEELPATPVPWTALRRRRRRHSLQVGGTVAAVAVACGGVLAGTQLLPSRGSGPGPATAVPAVAGALRPSRLLGAWTAQWAGGTSTRLQVDAGEATLRGPCGALAAAWVATADGQFSARFAYGDTCDGGATPDLPVWLTRATQARPDAAGWTLLDARGRTTARLTPDPTTTMPEITEDQRRRLDRDPPPLPAGKRPVTAIQIVGTWVPEELASAGLHGLPGHTEVTFNSRIDADPTGLTYLVDAGGHVAVAHGGATTSICATLPGEEGCADVPAWFDDTRVSYEQGRLVLYDASGRAVHTLVRS